MTRAEQLREKMQILEAERLLATVELRAALIRSAKQLLPEAVRQLRRGKGSRRTGSPALLRLIARLAMRRFESDLPTTSR